MSDNGRFPAREASAMERREHVRKGAMLVVPRIVDRIGHHVCTDCDRAFSEWEREE